MSSPSIESVPLGTPKAIKNFLTQVRRRLLTIEPQFTDAQAQQLLALIGQQRTVTTITNIAGSAPVFLTAPAVFFNSHSQPDWTEVDAKTYGVPAGATASILLAEYSNFGGADVEVDVLVSIDPPSGNYFRLLHGFRSNGEPTVAGQQGVMPLRSDGTFDWKMVQTFFGTGGLKLSILGYFSGAST